MNRYSMGNVSKEIVFLINTLGEGGAQRAMTTLVKQFIKEGKKVTILSLAKNNFYTLPSEVNVVYFTNHSKDSMLLIPYYAWKLKHYLQKHAISQVQSYLFRSNYVNLLSKCLGAKHRAYVANRSVVSRFFNEGFSGKVNIFLLKWLYPKADLVIHQSERMKLDFHQHFKMNNPEKVIYNAFDVENILLQANEPIDLFTFDPDKRYLVTVGRLIKLKRFQDVIYAMNRLPSDVELLLLGEGKEKASLEALAQELGLRKRVHFLGQVSNPFPYIKHSDIFISSSSIEGFPNVLVEAMLCKTTVISSDCVSGPREILAPSTDSAKICLKGFEKTPYGVLYTVGSIESLMLSISELLENSHLRLKYSEQAFDRAKSFSISHCVDDYIKL